MGDLVIFYGALVLTLVIRYGTSQFQEQLRVHFLPFTAIFIIWLLVFYITNLYELSVVKNTLQFFSSYFSIVAVNVGLAIAFFYLLPFAIAPRRNLFIFVAVAIILDVAWRTLYNRLLVRSGYHNNTLIVGLSDQAQELYDFLLTNPQLGYNALGIIDIENEAAARTLEKLIVEKNIKTLVIAREVYALPHIVDVLYRLVPLKLKFFNLPKFSERVTGKIPLSAIDQSWFLDNLSEGSKRAYELAKRLFDVAGAITIGVICSPVMLGIALSIKHQILYRQIRKGKAGQLFTLIKFRTMVPQAETDGAVWAKTNDPRVTRIGRFLRRTRLDELPQLWNVLKGDLSLVGPRPERPEFHEELISKIPFYNERYLIKPGAMGWAQLKYRYGASVADAAEKLQYDLYYIKNRSILLDASIILRTINIILHQMGR